MRDILRDIGHDPVPVTSGSKGIHLYAPLDGSQTTEQATQVARELALALEADHPDRVICDDEALAARWEGLHRLEPEQRRQDHCFAVFPSRAGAAMGRRASHLGGAGGSESRSSWTYEEVLARVGRLRRPTGADWPPRLTDRDRLATYRSMRDAAKTPEPVPARARQISAADGYRPSSSRSTTRGAALRLPAGARRRAGQLGGAEGAAHRSRGQPSRRADRRPSAGVRSPSTAASRRVEYGGGSVRIWDSGTYRLHKWRDGKEVIVTLFGQPDGGLGGVRKFALIHTGCGDSQPEKNWLMHLMETDPEDAAQNLRRRTELPVGGPATAPWPRRARFRSGNRVP